MTSAQLKNSFTSVGEVDASLQPATLSLLLTANYHQLVYFVMSNTHRQVIFFGKYALHHITNEESLCDAISNIHIKDEILNLKFGTVNFAYDSTYELVPDEFLFFTDRENFIVDTCLDMRFSIVSRRPDVLHKLIHAKFNNCHWRHMNTGLITRLSACLDDTTDKLFVQVAGSYLDVVRFNEQKQIRYMNRFAYQHANDFIYFLLLCADDLQVDRNKTMLVLMGEVDIQSKIYDLCYKYFLNISFAQKPESIHFSKAFDMFPKHLHYALYNSAL